MTRLSFDSPISPQPLETLPASGSPSETDEGSPGSFDDVLHQATAAANAAADERPSEPAQTDSPKTARATTNASRVRSRRSNPSADSQGSSASPLPSTTDASPPSDDSTKTAGGKTVDQAPTTGKDASTSDASTTTPADTASQATAASDASAPTSASGTPAANAGTDRGTTADKYRDLARGVAPKNQPGADAKTTVANGTQFLSPKKAGRKPAEATNKTAGDTAAKDSAAAIAPSTTDASSSASSSQDTAVAAATASAQASAHNGDPQAAAQVAQAANTSAVAADGTAGATQSPSSDAAATGSITGDAASTAGNAAPDSNPYLGGATGKSTADRRRNTIESSPTADDDSTAETGQTLVAALASEPSHEPANANPVEATLAKAATLTPPTTVEATKSQSSPAVTKNDAPAGTTQSQGSATAGVSATSATGQATAGVSATSTTGPAAPGSSQADQVRLVQRVAAAFQSLGDGGGTVRLRLSPPELGAVKVEVSVHNGVMNARLETETSAARSLLLDNLPDLRDRLAQQQIKVERFDIDLAGQSSGGMPQSADQQTPQQSQSHGTASGRGRSQGAQAVESASAPPAVRTAARGRFDVTI